MSKLWRKAGCRCEIGFSGDGYTMNAETRGEEGKGREGEIIAMIEPAHGKEKDRDDGLFGS